MPTPGTPAGTAPRLKTPKMSSRLLEHAGAAVVDRQEHGVADSLDADADRAARGRVLDGVREQVLDDALHLGCVDLGLYPLGPHLDRAAVGLVGRHDRLDEPADVGRNERWAVEAVSQPVDVEQVGEETVEPSGLHRQVLEERRAILVAQRLTSLPQSDRDPEDRGERRAELVRDGGEDVVAELVQLLPLRHVLGGARHPGRRSGLVGDHAARCVQPADGAGREDETVLEGERLQVRVGGLDDVSGSLAVLGMDALEE